MTVAMIRTKAEQALSDAFDAVAARLPGDKEVAESRRQAIARFGELGLPHCRVEEWKYTDLRVAMKEALPPAIGDATKVSISDVIVSLGALARLDATRIVFVNGAYRSDLSPDATIAGLEIVPLSEALTDGTGLQQLTQFTGAADDAVVALNTAYVTDGAVLRVADGAVIEKPILLAYIRAGRERRFAVTRDIVTVGKNARVTIIEAHAGVPGPAADGQINSATELVIGDDAEITHIQAAIDPGNVTHLSSTMLTLGKNSVHRGFQLTTGTALSRHQCFVTFGGEGAKLDLSGLMLGRGSSHTDTTLVIDHAVPRCDSRELFKCVLDGTARAVFQGKVIVRPGAQKTDGKQMAQALMLSPDAEFDSKPELEIYADDVVCGHGSTAAELDDDLMFYCRSRGIPTVEARALLIEAFAVEAIEKIADETVREAIASIARTWLNKL